MGETFFFRSEGVGICRRFYVTSRGYVERSASFAPALVDMSNAPPASLHLSWICRTLRQFRSAKRGKIDGPTPVYRRFGRGFSTSSGMTPVLDSDARERLFDRTVTVYFLNVPWDQVLDVVLMNHGLSA